MNWSPAQLTFATWEEMKEHPEYVGVEANVEVHIDKRTGKKLYTGRTRSTLSPAREEEVARLRSESAALLEPLTFSTACQLNRVSGAATDDVLDALVACWTARRIHAGTAIRLPPTAPVDARGLRMEPWR